MLLLLMLLFSKLRFFSFYLEVALNKVSVWPFNKTKFKNFTAFYMEYNGGSNTHPYILQFHPTQFKTNLQQANNILLLKYLSWKKKQANFCTKF